MLKGRNKEVEKKKKEEEKAEMLDGPKVMSDDYRHDLQIFYKFPHRQDLKWINKHMYPTVWGPV